LTWKGHIEKSITIFEELIADETLKPEVKE
jgi:hypothetical protein